MTSLTKGMGTPDVRLGPGAYRIGAKAYHEDPCEAPALSASIAHTLLAYSPRHAWLAHPRLNPQFMREHDSRFDVGSAAHALLLGDPASFEVVDADSWRTKEAQAKREDAWAEGRIPLLADQYEHAKQMAEAALLQLVAHEIGNPFTEGEPEVALVWRDAPSGYPGKTLCRALLDWCPAEPEKARVIRDFKSTSGSANPEGVLSRLLGTGADIQAALYTRGYSAVFECKRPAFQFVVQETEPPYALSVVELDPAAMVVADKKVDEALTVWARCVEEGVWPGYPSRVATIGAPSWYEQRQIEREGRQELDREAGIDTFKTWLHWQAPSGFKEGTTL